MQKIIGGTSCHITVTAKECGSVLCFPGLFWLLIATVRAQCQCCNWRGWSFVVSFYHLSHSAIFVLHGRCANHLPLSVTSPSLWFCAPAQIPSPLDKPWRKVVGCMGLEVVDEAGSDSINSCESGSRLSVLLVALFSFGKRSYTFSAPLILNFVSLCLLMQFMSCSWAAT